MIQIPISIMGTKKGDAALSIYSEMLASRLEELRQQDSNNVFAELHDSTGWPINIHGKCFNVINSLFLILNSASKGYSSRIYMTESEANNVGLEVTEPGKGFPIIFFDSKIVDKSSGRWNKKLNYQSWKAMPEGERDKYECYVFSRAINVYNIEQTDLRSRNSECYKKIISNFNLLFTNKESAFKKKKLLQDWLDGSIDVLASNTASALAWELAFVVFYGSLGFDWEITEIHRQYIDEWLEELHKNTDFLIKAIPEIEQNENLLISQSAKYIRDKFPKGNHTKPLQP